MTHDSLIDAAAREMTKYEPSPDFRARVVRQLAVPTRRWLPIIASVATVAAGIAVVAVVLRPGAPDPVVAPTATQAQQVTASTPSSVDTNPRSGEARPVHRAATRGPAPDSRITEEELAWHARALPPLPALTPVVIEPIQPSALSITPIVVTPLVTEPLTVPPIDDGAGGRSPIPQVANSPIS